MLEMRFCAAPSAKPIASIPAIVAAGRGKRHHPESEFTRVSSEMYA
jgi:hypothetical protein